MAENQPEDIAALEQTSKGFDPTLLDKEAAELTPEQVKAIQANSKTQFALKKHWQKKASDTTPAPAPAASPTNQPTPTEQAPNGSEARIVALEQAEEKRQFGHSNNLTPEETDHVFALARGFGIKPKEALDRPVVKSMIESLRSQDRANGAIPGPSPRSPVVGGKKFSEMNEQEKRQNFSQVTASLVANRKK